MFNMLFISDDDNFEVIDFASVSAGIKEIDDFEEIIYQPPVWEHQVINEHTKYHKSRLNADPYQYSKKKSNTNITASKLKQLASKRKKSKSGSLTGIAPKVLKLSSATVYSETSSKANASDHGFIPTSVDKQFVSEVTLHHKEDTWEEKKVIIDCKLENSKRENISFNITDYSPTSSVNTGMKRDADIQNVKDPISHSVCTSNILPTNPKYLTLVDNKELACRTNNDHSSNESVARLLNKTLADSDDPLYVPSNEIKCSEVSGDQNLEQVGGLADMYSNTCRNDDNCVKFNSETDSRSYHISKDNLKIPANPIVETKESCLTNTSEPTVRNTDSCDVHFEVISSSNKACDTFTDTSSDLSHHFDEREKSDSIFNITEEIEVEMLPLHPQSEVEMLPLRPQSEVEDVNMRILSPNSVLQLKRLEDVNLLQNDNAQFHIRSGIEKQMSSFENTSNIETSCKTVPAGNKFTFKGKIPPVKRRLDKSELFTIHTHENISKSQFHAGREDVICSNDGIAFVTKNSVDYDLGCGNSSVIMVQDVNRSSQVEISNATTAQDGCTFKDKEKKWEL